MLPPAPDDPEEIEAMLAAVRAAAASLDVALTAWHQVALETSMPDDDMDVAVEPTAPDEAMYSMVVPTRYKRVMRAVPDHEELPVRASRPLRVAGRGR